MVRKWSKSMDFQALLTILGTNALQKAFTAHLEILISPTSGLPRTEAQIDKNQFKLFYFSATWNI